MPELSYRMVRIAGVPAGLLGLEELFGELFESGCQPKEPATLQRIIRGVRKHNYIPRPALGDYTEVLGEEYQRYYQARSGGQAAAPRDYGQWEGHPREQIPWFPTISAELCNGCGKCIEVCPKDVFMKSDRGIVEVVEPFLCIVGCCFCKSACDPQAILMPQRTMLAPYRHGQRHA